MCVQKACKDTKLLAKYQEKAKEKISVSEKITIFSQKNAKTFAQTVNYAYLCRLFCASIRNAVKWKTQSVMKA
jgi:hypothetical protein